MSVSYLECLCNIKPLDPGVEILIAELGTIGFESFVEHEEGVTAYIQKGDWEARLLEEVQVLKSPEFEIDYIVNEIAPVNWNEAWEQHFEPIVVSNTCAVRAPFHNPYGVPFEIVIEPKMSFGTGHHETTFMMLQFILENDFQGKRVLDMGCGTAVLAILASMKRAKTLDAIDIDDWCVENSEENIARNQCQNIAVKLGDATLLPSQKIYDTILANINRNILLQDMERYVASLKKGGELYLSGFYIEDLPQIKACCNNLGLIFVENKEKNKWVSAKFVH